MDREEINHPPTAEGRAGEEDPMTTTEQPQAPETGAQVDAEPLSDDPGTSGRPEAPEAPEAAEGHSGPNRKEAKYRVERNEARAERDALAERLAEYQRADVLRQAGDLSDASDLFGVGGYDLQSFLTEAGSVDNAAVAEAVADLITTRPGLAKVPPPSPAFDRTQGTGGLVGKPSADLGDAFRPELWK
jgi:hypothetical protein